MKNKVLKLFPLVLSLNLGFASSTFNLPKEFMVNQKWMSLTKSYDIETKTEKLGTLYRRFLTFLLTYDFYDSQNVKTATAKARFFSYNLHLDIYDQSEDLIGEVEEKLFYFFPTFEVIDKNSIDKLARAEMNFWGTKFNIYDPQSNQEMAVMSRSFFRLKDDWTINITNPELLKQKNIDPRVLMTVIAVQGEIEEWETNYQNNRSLQSNPNFQMNNKGQFPRELKQKITRLAKENKLDNLALPPQSNLEALADELDHGFKMMYPNISELSNEEQLYTYTNYCLNQVSAPEQTDSKKKAILTLLNLRLKGH